MQITTCGRCQSGGLAPLGVAPTSWAGGHSAPTGIAGTSSVPWQCALMRRSTIASPASCLTGSKWLCHPLGHWRTGLVSRQCCNAWMTFMIIRCWSSDEHLQLIYTVSSCSPSYRSLHHTAVIEVCTSWRKATGSCGWRGIFPPCAELECPSWQLRQYLPGAGMGLLSGSMLALEYTEWENSPHIATALYGQESCGICCTDRQSLDNPASIHAAFSLGMLGEQRG